MFSTEKLTDEDLHAMWAACSEISSAPGRQQACSTLSQRLSQIIAAPAFVFNRRVSAWKPVAGCAANEGVATPPSRALKHLPLLQPPVINVIAGSDGSRWTPLALSDSLAADTLLLLPGDWHQGPVASWLPRFAKTAAMALQLAAAHEGLRTREGVASGAYSFARKVADIRGTRLLYQFIINEVSRQANARRGGLSVYQRQEGVIRVAATYGYSTDVVGQVRVEPGTGIIGGVFATRKSLLVRDTTRVPGLMLRRHRYQTPSFMAVPIVAADEALGVITLADRTDGRPFTRQDLLTVQVISAVSSLALIRQQLTERAEALAQAVAVDPLTGMYNRRYLETQLDAEIQRSRRSGVPLSLMMIDVDSFKPVNDQLGHQTGDAVLRKIGEIVKQSVRASDVCTRYAGDEFLVVVLEGAAAAQATAERIRSRVEAVQWASMGLPERLRVTISVGITASQPGDGAQELIKRADRGLYRAKALGRNRVYAAEPEGLGPARADAP